MNIPLILGSPLGVAEKDDGSVPGLRYHRVVGMRLVTTECTPNIRNEAWPPSGDNDHIATKAKEVKVRQRNQKLVNTVLPNDKLPSNCSRRPRVVPFSESRNAIHRNACATNAAKRMGYKVGI